jgi:hypothetical protein
MSTAIWKFQLSTLKWVSMEPHRGEAIYNAPGITADYDPNTRAIYVADRQNFLRYDSQTNTLSKLASLPNMDYHLTGVVDPVRKLFILAGGPGQFWAIQIGPHAKREVHDWSKRSTGCEKLLHAPFPGLTFDPVQSLLVGWVGGDSVILFNPDTMSCTEQSYPGGPGAAQKDGTSGRFRYVPALEAFVIVNDWKENAFFLRLGVAMRKSP